MLSFQFESQVFPVTKDFVVLQPFEFTAGDVVSGVAVKKISDSANGLFAGSGGPKPPSALGTAVLGMRVGGKVSLCNCHCICKYWVSG